METPIEDSLLKTAIYSYRSPISQAATIRNAPCMKHLPTLTREFAQMKVTIVTIPYMEHIMWV